MDAADLNAEYRARRVRIVVQLVFYPLALGLIVLAWQHYRGGSSQAHGEGAVLWTGSTSQGKPMRASINNGVLMTFSTRVLESCSDGTVFTLHWYPGPQRFVQQGEDVQGVQAGGARTNSGAPDLYENRVWAHIDDQPSGTIWAVDNMTRARRTVHCDSGPVTFTLHRQR